jgi:hypothetical protein
VSAISALKWRIAGHPAPNCGHAIAGVTADRKAMTQMHAKVVDEVKQSTVEEL